MKIKGVFLAAILTVVLCISGNLSAATYGGGSGTQPDPYQIWTPQQMNTIGATPADWGSHFKLMDDIDMSIYTGTQYNIIGTAWNNAFTGTFDGNGYVISNLTYTTTAAIYYVGLFGYTYGATIQNLGVENVSISSGGGCIGGLVGENYIYCTLTACYAIGTVTGTSESVGGLVGGNSGTLIGCYATGSVTGISYVGGLVGYNNTGSLTACYATGTVTGTGDSVGGLMGENSYGTITGSYATGAVSGTDNVGGLVGFNNSGTLTACYGTGSVSGTDNVGGLMGYDYSGMLTSCFATGAVSGTGFSVGGLMGFNNSGTLTACYGTGSVSGLAQVGGLMGHNFFGTLTDCYATGPVSGTAHMVGGLVGDNYTGNISSCYATGSVTGISYVGGLVGINSSGTVTACYATGLVTGPGYVGGLMGATDEGSVTICFWDTETSGQTGSASGKGLTTCQMKSITTYQNSGWADKGWVINDGLDYPRLAWENSGGVPIPQLQPIPLLGSGSEPDPYQIWTADDFALLSWYVDILDKHIALMVNLDLNDEVLYPIGDLGIFFTGVFDGNGHILHNAVINQPGSNYVGLFNYVGSSGQIRNLGVENANITGHSNVGGLVGYNSGTLTACYMSGSVSATSYVGGLIGMNYGTLIGCYTNGLVSNNGYYSYSGGLVGVNNGSIIACYSTSSVSGTYYVVGGLVGSNVGSLTGCYSTGSVSGSQAVGGLVGANSGWLTNCYATGSVIGEHSIGGLVGENWGSLTACYATGTVGGSWDYSGGLVGYDGSVSIACFWDIQTSGTSDGVGNVNPDPAGAMGKTTAEMKTLSIFTSAGWDFTTIWAICEGTNYPRLRWQIPAGDFVCPDGVGMEDMAVLAEQWLCEKLSYDIAPGTGDDIVNFFDWAVFANTWQGDMAQLVEFTGQWLKSSDYNADVDINGDGIVNMLDFAVLAEHWLEGQ